MSEVPLSSLGHGATALISALRELEEWVLDFPVKDNVVGRFGNPAFRDWHKRLVERAPRLMADVVSASRAVSGAEVVGAEDNVAIELGAYLDTSFGNETRIDYGSGHEAHFCLLLHLLETLDVISEAEFPGVALIVFPAYLRVTRRLQDVYRLEPAGSRGVWGLDDYSFLPFLWGSSQLLSSTRVPPTVVEDDSMLDELREEYIYLDAIKVIKDVKKGSFFEHSPILNSISQVKAGWPKINQGMLKMYKGEVWLKLQVVQMFLFGKLYPFNADA